MYKNYRSGIAIVLVMLMLFGIAPALFSSENNVVYAAGGFEGGDGSVGNPYQVSSVAQLDEIRNFSTSYFILTSDIDMTGVTWTPIPNFSGTLDGDYFKIINLASTADVPFSFIQFLNSDGVIKNIGFENVNIVSSSHVGNLSTIANEIKEGAKISSCVVTGSITLNSTGNNFAYIGGIAVINRGTVEKCYVDMTLTASNRSSGQIGGIVAKLDSSLNTTTAASISECWTKGSIVGTAYLGGVSGYNFGNVNVPSNSMIDNCLSEMSISVSNQRGAGISGQVYYTDTTKCLATGSVAGTTLSVGGLFGLYHNSSTDTSCFFDTETTLQTQATTNGVTTGSTGETTANLMKQATFIDWDFTNIWNITEDTTYPQLRWYSAWEIIRASKPSSDATLSSLTLSSGTLSPSFDSNTNAYTSTVSNDIAEITVTPTSVDGNATITVNGVAVNSGEASGNIALDVGINTITIVVTAENGVTTKTYVIELTREVGVIVEYDFNELYDVGDEEIFVDIHGNSTCEKYNTATSAFGTNGALEDDQTYWTWTADGEPGGGLTIDVNQDISTSYSIGVRFSYNEIIDDYLKIIDYSNKGSDNGFYFYDEGYVTFYPHDTLGSIQISNGQIVDIVATRNGEDNTFTAYIIIDGSLVKEFEVDDTDGDALPSLVDGKTRFGFFYDDEDTQTEYASGGKVYSIKIWDGPISQEEAEGAMSNLPDLSNLEINQGTLSPEFSSGPKNYTATVGNDVTDITVTPTAAENTSTITVNGVAVNSGEASGNIALNVGANTITIIVTAADGVTTKTYSIVVTREASPSSDSTLSNLTLNNGTLSPTFDSNTTDYTSSVSNAISEITVTPTSADGNATITVNGVAVNSGETSGNIALNVGANTLTIIVTAEDAITTKTYTITITRANASSGGSSGGSSQGSSTPSNETAVSVIVNGKTENVGTEVKTIEDGKKTVTLSVNNTAIDGKIDEAIKKNSSGDGNIVEFPVADKTAEIAKVELTGDIVKKLEDTIFDVSIIKDAVEYIIPAEELTISNVAKELGVSEDALKDIKVEVQITKLNASVIEKYNEIAQANNAELIFPPVAFEIVARTTKADGSTSYFGIDKFNNYVERVIEIPEGVDPSKITTGIVFNPDGNYSHVPTEVFQEDGKWYAKLNSLTNSNYSVIWNPITVKSVENHWAEDAVNDMASRLIVFNVDSFEPDQAITRADFAEYIVRALGLYREGTTYENKYSDVKDTNDRSLAIMIANEYGIVIGYEDGTFRGENGITREEAMTMYQRAMLITKLEGKDDNRFLLYSDSSLVSAWAVSYVSEVLSANVFNGTSKTTISPKSKLTNAEAVQAIKNLLVESGLINK